MASKHREKCDLTQLPEYFGYKPGRQYVYRVFPAQVFIRYILNFFLVFPALVPLKYVLGNLALSYSWPKDRLVDYLSKFEKRYLLGWVAPNPVVRLTVKDCSFSSVLGDRAMVKLYDLLGFYWVIYYLHDEDGISIIAVQTLFDVEPARIEPKFPLIKYPLVKNSVWEEEESSNQGIINQRRLVVEGLNRNVVVPAGSYSKCLLIKDFFCEGKVSSSRTLGENKKQTLFSRESLTFYAPGVGLVRAIEKLDGLKIARLQPEEMWFMQLEKIEESPF